MSVFLQVELAVLLGADRQRAETEMGAALEFERQLANVSLQLCRLFNIALLL